MMAVTRRNLLLGAVALPTLLAACSSGTETTATDEGQETQEEQGDAQLLGGWQLVAPGDSLVDDEVRALFEQAVEGADASYEPVAVLAQQVVAGMNYAFLASCDPEADGSWAVVVVYKDLDGNASLTSVTLIDPANVSTCDENATAGMLGAWEVLEQEGATLYPEEAQTAFDAALEGFVGVGLNPIACLARQVVSGTNYLVLCGGAPVVADPVPVLYVVTVYADLEGNAEFSDVSMFDLLAYIG